MFAWRSSVRVAAIAAAALFVGSVPAGADQALTDAYAPTGKLRAVINVGNAVLALRSSPDAPASGISVDIAQELGKRLGVAVEPIVVTSAGQAVALVNSGKADIGFFAIDPKRAEGIAFSTPYVSIEGAYLVRQDSPLTRNDEVDRSGIRIVVGLNSAYDLFLTREIKSATLVRTPTSAVVVATFMEQKLEVAAGVRQQLEADAKRVSGLRFLPGRFMVIHQAMGIAKDRNPIAHVHLTRFVEEMKASGFVASAITKHNISGVGVSAPGPAAP